MLTVLIPVLFVVLLGYAAGRAKALGADKVAGINDLTLREAALKLGVVSASELDRIVDPRKMVQPYVAGTRGDA